jgi:DNA processing protein
VLEPILDHGTTPASAQELSQEQLGLSDAEPDADDRTRIVDLLGPAPVSVDDLVRLSRTSPTVVRGVLLELEIAGRLERHGAGLVSRL